MTKKYLYAGAALLTFSVAGCGGSDEAGDASGQLDGEPMEMAMDGDDSMPEEQVPPPAPTIKLNLGEGALTSPSDFQVAVAFYQIIGLEPPFREWASSDNRVRNANEFDRAEAISRVEQELTLAASAVSNIGYITINTNSDFGEYDMESQGFYLEDISSSRFWTWNYKGSRFKLTMENGNEAKLWKIPADQARQIVEANNYRNVRLNLKIKITNAVPEENGGVLKGKIVSYEVHNRREDGLKYGEMTFN